MSGTKNCFGCGKRLLFEIQRAKAKACRIFWRYIGVARMVAAISSGNPRSKHRRQFEVYHLETRVVGKAKETIAEKYNVGWNLLERLPGNLKRLRMRS